MFRGTDRSRPLSKASKIGLLDQLGLILKKELLHSFRDRDVFLYTVLIPCLVYPFLSFVGVEFTLLTQSADKDKPLQVAYIEQEPGSSPDAEVVKAYDFLQRAVKASKNKVELQPMAREKPWPPSTGRMSAWLSVRLCRRPVPNIKAPPQWPFSLLLWRVRI